MIQGHQLRVCLLIWIAGICCVNAAFALDPSRALTQYVHDKWGADRGFLGGTVYAICQSDDGYLWIGTERGLVRFDGSSFVLMQRPVPGSPAIGAVRGLVADNEGNMWIRIDGPHLLRYRERRFEDTVPRFGLHQDTFTAMSLDNKGNLILWGLGNGTLRFRGGKFESLTSAGDLSGTTLSVAETLDHKVWLGTRDEGLFQINQGRSSSVSRELVDTSINTLLPAKNGGLWIGTDFGIEFRDRNGLLKIGAQSVVKQRQILALVLDHNANVWVGTENGLIRISPDGTISSDQLNHNSDSEVTAIYEDRDGDIWFGGLRGIERLRDGIFTTYSTAQGLPSEHNGPVYVDTEGRTWFGPLSGGLYWLKDGHVERVAIAGLDGDVVYSISGGGGEVWVARQHGGLTVLTKSGDSFVSRTYTKAEGLLQSSVYSVHRNRDGTIWIGTVNAGTSKLKDGKFTNYSVANGLVSNSVNSIVEGYDGTMWFATAGGLASFSDGNWLNRSAADGLPSSNIRSIFEDSKHTLWIATSGGLAFLQSDQIGVPRKLPDSLHEEIFGIAEDKTGYLWFATSDHVLQVDRDRLVAGTINTSDVQSYGIADGLQGVEGVRRDRSLIADPLGRVWLSSNRGLAVADPEIILNSSPPMAVRIESISANGIQVDLKNPLKFAARSQSIALNYASTALSTPERVKFRYELDGSDRGWSDIVASRQVVFSHLNPGTYRFRIVASNVEGLWNGPETIVPFVIEPAFWQTWWFFALSLAMCGLAAVMLYRRRMHQLTRQLSIRFQERLAERTRIARDFHDTLLQGFLSASMQLDVAEDQLPANSPTKPVLKRILHLMRQVNEEGRAALNGLRTVEDDNHSLELAFSRMRQEFAIDEKISYRVVAYSSTRPLRLQIRDEVYRIGREAIINVLLHAKANTVEVEVEYASKYLRVVVRDDGCGIDPHVLDTGREGHWGLTGMRERSESIGAKLILRSRIDAGTEVELKVPGTIAFESQFISPVSKWMNWLGQEKSGPRLTAKGDGDERR
jgi:signal transduction histidine kinase/ligand-binding sensor domain-containing protein